MAKTKLFHWLAKEIGKHPHSNPTLTRREFLQGIGALGLGLLATPPLSAWANASQSAGSVNALANPAERNRQVVIIGAGLAGLSTAYYLRQHGVNCSLYEASARSGGRIYTQGNFNADGMFAEIGGELIDTAHQDILGLCQELAVPVQAFAPFDAGLEPSLFWGGGQIRSLAEVREAFTPLLGILARDAQHCFGSGAIFVPTYRQPANCHWLDRLSLERYLDDMADQVQPWLLNLIKAAYTGEYGCEPSEQSALNLLLLLGSSRQNSDVRFYGDSDEAYRIAGGSSRLAEALQSRLQTETPMYFQHELIRVALESDKPTAPMLLNFRLANGDTRTVIAEQVVLALPFSILRHIPGVQQLPLSEVKKRCIAEWQYGSNSKRILGFKNRFWRRQQIGNLSANTGEIFSDLPSQCFWECSRLQPGQSGILTNFLGGRAGKQARSQDWPVALADLETIYRVPPASLADTLDGNRACFNWDRNPYSRGSYSCPAPGHYTTLAGSAGEPELEGRILFAGEHCSLDWMGYMNGAVESAKRAVQSVLSDNRLKVLT